MHFNKYLNIEMFEYIVSIEYLLNINIYLFGTRTINLIYIIIIIFYLINIYFP